MERNINFGDEPPEDYPELFFARPTKDSKQFTGQVFSKEAWSEWNKELENSNIKQNLNLETKILIAPCKEIQQEIRCWIVKGQPVSISQYKIGRRVNYLNMDNNQEAQIFSRNMAKIYQPAEAFVMDICLTDDEYKIVEINCLNCSGFYDVDMSKLIQSLENNFN